MRWPEVLACRRDAECLKNRLGELLKTCPLSNSLPKRAVPAFELRNLCLDNDTNANAFGYKIITTLHRRRPAEDRPAALDKMASYSVDYIIFG